MHRNPHRNSAESSGSGGYLLMVSAFALSILLLGFVSPAWAEFSVQIGAFREPAPSFTEKAEGIGKLYRSQSPTGLTRLQVGRFATKKEADVARTALLGAGYAGAFVVEKGVRLQAAADSTKNSNVAGSRERVIVSKRSLRASDPMAGVPEDLRDRVVILDGRLHVVEGESFIPLDEYLRSQPTY